MAKKPTKSVKKLLPKEQPTKLNMTFDQFIKKAVTTPIEGSKIDKK